MVRLSAAWRQAWPIEKTRQRKRTGGGLAACTGKSTTWQRDASWRHPHVAEAVVSVSLAFEGSGVFVSDKCFFFLLSYWSNKFESGTSSREIYIERGKTRKKKLWSREKDERKRVR